MNNKINIIIINEKTTEIFNMPRFGSVLPKKEGTTTLDLSTINFKDICIIDRKMNWKQRIKFLFKGK